MRFRLFGTEIYVSFLFCAVITVMLATDRTGYCLPTLCAAAFHEIGHLFAMWVFECQPKAVRLIPASISIVSPFPKKKYGEFVIAFAGPLINIVLFLSLMINYKITHSRISFEYGIINLVIGLFNLLPVKGLDGGTIVFLTAEKLTKNPVKAERTVKNITLFTGVLFIATGLYILYKGNINISFIIMGAYVLICAFLR